MNSDRVTNAKRNIITAFIFKIVVLFFPFVIRIIIIRKLGAEYAGLSSLFGSILSFLNLADLGVGSAIVFSMYSPIAKGDDEKVSQLLNYFKKVYRITSIVIISSGIIVLPFVKTLIKDGYPHEINIYLLYLIYLFNSAGSYCFGAYRQSLFSAHQREDVISLSSVVINIVFYLFQMIILLTTGNYYYYASLIALCNISINIFLYSYSAKAYPSIKPIGFIDGHEKKQLYKGVGGLFINRIASSIRNSCDTICVTAFCGLVMTTVYSNYYMILMAVNGILLLFGQSIRAGVGAGVVSNTKEKNYSDYMTAQMIYMLVSGVAAIGIYCFGSLVVGIAFGEKYVLSDFNVLLIALYLFVMKMIDINNVFIDASGMWWKTKVVTIAEAATNLVLDYILGVFFGVSGIIIATIISLYLFSFVFKTLAVFRTVFEGIKPVGYFAFQHCVVLIMAFAVFSSGLLVGNIETPLIKNITSFILASSLYCIIYSCVFYKNKYYIKSKQIVVGSFRINSFRKR